MTQQRIELLSVVQNRISPLAPKPVTGDLLPFTALSAPDAQPNDLIVIFHCRHQPLPQLSAPSPQEIILLSPEPHPELGTHIAIQEGSHWALIDALLYVWLVELDSSPFDHHFIQQHVYGFAAEQAPANNELPWLSEADSYRGYLLGWPDAKPKTAEWAAKLTGLESSQIRALALTLAEAKTLRVVTADPALQQAQLLPLLRGHFRSPPLTAHSA
ncbi:hypothetical protein [Ferrimonas pelagia]|uniref:Uncharacterized protein n=1 Tax=Ferrimonas pelagia TaxID=1177826 RepID=A0ABP9F757_9GAMM